MTPEQRIAAATLAKALSNCRHDSGLGTAELTMLLNEQSCRCYDCQKGLDNNPWKADMVSLRSPDRQAICDKCFVKRRTRLRKKLQEAKR
jgi:Zn finger protein HypA/HybF involved in hydrogenase expression